MNRCVETTRDETLCLCTHSLQAIRRVMGPSCPTWRALCTSPNDCLPGKQEERGESDCSMQQQPPTRQSKYLLHSVLKMVWILPGMKLSGCCAKAAGEQSTASATQAATPGAQRRTPIPAQMRQAPRKAPVVRRSVTEPSRGYEEQPLEIENFAILVRGAPS